MRPAGTGVTVRELVGHEVEEMDRREQNRRKSSGGNEDRGGIPRRVRHGSGRGRGGSAQSVGKK